MPNTTTRPVVVNPDQSEAILRSLVELADRQRFSRSADYFPFRCDCPDHVYRSSRTRRPCKHVVAVACAALDAAC